MTRSQLDRGSFLRGSAIAAGAAITGFPAFIPSRSSAADTIKIGANEEITGVYAIFAKNEINGMNMALAEHNKRGGVMGRQVELVVQDNANNPGTSVEKARQMIQSDKVVAMLGTVSSADSTAVSNVCFESKTPFIDSGGHADAVTGTSCHFTTFRTCHDTWAETQATGISIEKKFGKKWYYLAPDYNFGHSLVDGYNALKTKLGINVVGTDFAPLGTADFSSYLAKVQSANPDVLILMVQGDDLINCIKQANSSGLLKRIPIAGPQGELEVFWSLPKEARVGSWGFEWYYDSPLVLGSSASAKAFVKNYTAQFKEPPSARGAFGYISMNAMLDAMTAAKSLDGIKIAQALSGMHVDALHGGAQSYFRTADHQLMWPEWFGEVRSNGTGGDPNNIINIFDAEPPERSEHSDAEAGTICKMPKP